MDLSLKKADVQVASQDIPQDLSIKKSKPAAKTVASPSVGGKAKVSALVAELEKPRTVIEPRDRVMPGLDQFIRTVMELQPRSLADQHLRTLAHQKAKTFADQKKKSSADLRPTTLVVPKRSALVIPNPRNRTFLEQTTKAGGGQAADLPSLKHKPRKTKPSEDVQPTQGLDLRKKLHSVQATSGWSLLETRQQSASVSKAFHQIWTPPLANGTCPSQPVVKQITPSQKRRRKQECPKKRVKLDSYVAEEVDTSYLLSEEFLDKVTDAAQNGELSKGLDAYFGHVPQDQDNSSAEDTDKKNLPDFAQTLHLQDLEREGVDSEAVSPSSSADSSVSLFKSPSVSPKQKVKTSRVAASLQNREQRKALRLYGKEYTTPSGKTYPQRKVRDKDCSKCRYNCSSSVTAEQRQTIFEHFWSLDSYVKRLYYYCQSIKEKPAKTMKHTRECSREYTFLVDGERVRVCKGFYLATLDVSDKAVRIAMEKRKRGKGMWDKRGAHPPHNKTRPEDKDRVRSHIESFLIMDIYSKTCDSSPTSIPGQDLNVTKMHQDYAQDCKDEGREPVSEDVYRRTFNTEYNLSSVQV